MKGFLKVLLIILIIIMIVMLVAMVAAAAAGATVVGPAGLATGATGTGVAGASAAPAASGWVAIAKPATTMAMTAATKSSAMIGITKFSTGVLNIVGLGGATSLKFAIAVVGAATITSLLLLDQITTGGKGLEAAVDAVSDLINSIAKIPGTLLNSAFDGLGDGLTGGNKKSGGFGLFGLALAGGVGLAAYSFLRKKDDGTEGDNAYATGDEVGSAS